MKYILTTIVLLTILSCNAQTQIVSLTKQNLSNFTEGIYLKDTQGLLTPYVGTWKWQSGNSSLTIVIEKLTMDYEATTTKQYRDKLVGRIKYIENGVEKMNTITSIKPTLGQKNGVPIDNSLSFIYRDPYISSKFGGHVDLDLINNNNNMQIKFKLRNTEGPRFTVPGEQYERPNFSIPKNIDFVLTKTP